MIKWIRMNLKMIRVINSCSYKQFYSFLMDYIFITENWKKFFTSKWYIWNVIRPRDFYKMIAMFITSGISEAEAMMYGSYEELTSAILSSTKDMTIKKSFVWNITKNTPLFMYDMLPYMSSEKIVSMLTNKEYLISDDILSPFVDVIMKLRSELEDNYEK